MKNRDYRMLKIKNQLRRLKQNGVEYVLWSLNDEQTKYVENLGYEVIPCIFKIRAKRLIFKDTWNKSSLLRQVNFSKKASFIRKLSKKEQRLLDENDVYYTPVKKKIVLNWALKQPRRNIKISSWLYFWFISFLLFLLEVHYLVIQF